MAKKTATTKQQVGVSIVATLAFFGLAYLFASLAIDSGSLLQYFIGTVCLFLGVRSAILAVRYGKKLT